MSYQLPDLLTLLTTLSSDNGDVELHINPAYQSVADSSAAWLLANLQRSQDVMTMKSQLQRTLRGFLDGYNPGLLASTYFPFLSVSNTTASPSALQVSAEWLGLCAVLAEDVLRPNRISDYRASSSALKSGPETTLDGIRRGTAFQCIMPRLSSFYSPNTKEVQESIQRLLDAHIHPPSKPDPGQPRIEEYLRWRIELGGHRVLAEVFLPSRRSERAQRLLVITLEVIACVMDLFSFNIHQAWHRNRAVGRNNHHDHLNLVAFLRTADPELTLQGAVNIVGEMIQQRIMKIKELITIQDQSLPENTTKDSGGILATLLSSFFSVASSSSSHPETDTNHQHFDVVTDSNGTDSTDEAQRMLLCWLTGAIHWAYEADCFLPDSSSESEEQEMGNVNTKKRKKKRGSEIRDYGWIFLIQEEEAVKQAST